MKESPLVIVGVYGELVNKHGVDSLEVKDFLNANKEVEELVELAPLINRMRKRIDSFNLK